jgi:hypothetical protein
MRYITSLSYDDIKDFKNLLKDASNRNIDEKVFLDTLYTFLYIEITGIDKVKHSLFETNVLPKFKGQIDRDTINRKKIEEQPNDKKYIFINNYISMIEYMLEEPLRYDTILKKLIVHINNNSTFLIAFVNNFHHHIEDKNRNNAIISEITKKLNKKINNSVLTYVKLRSDNSSSSYSKRFRVFTNFNKHDVYDMKYNTLVVKYNDHNFPYYDANGNELDTEQLKKYGDIYSINNFKIDNPSYEDEYVFGHLTRIFRVNQTNKDIAKEMHDVQTNLLLGKPVFIIGYGASGAGKTSTLIYFNKEKEYQKKNGVLIHMCDLMAEQGYTEIEVKTYEFYHDKDNLYKQRVTPPNDSYVSFSYQNSGFVANKEYPHTNTFIERSIKASSSSTMIHSPNGVNTTFMQGCPLGEFIIHMIDTDRYVRATTNNPNSSRSHTLVFVKFKNTNTNTNSKKYPPTTTLIVGDFAGVENAFDCNNDDILQKILNIKQDDGSQNLFYNNISKMGGKRHKIRKMKGGTLDESKCQQYISNNEPFFTFGKKPYYPSSFSKAPSIYTNLRLMIANYILKHKDVPPFKNTLQVLAEKPNVDDKNYKNIVNVLTSFWEELKNKKFTKDEALSNFKLKEKFFALVASKIILKDDNLNASLDKSTYVTIRTVDNGMLPNCNNVEYDDNKQLAKVKSICPVLKCLFSEKYKMKLTMEPSNDVNEKIKNDLKNITNENDKTNMITLRKRIHYYFNKFLPVDRQVEESTKIIQEFKKRWFEGVQKQDFTYKLNHIMFDNEIQSDTRSLEAINNFFYNYLNKYKTDSAYINTDFWNSTLYVNEIQASSNETETMFVTKNIKLSDITEQWRTFFSNSVFLNMFGIKFSSDQHLWFLDIYNAVINTLVNDEDVIVDGVEKYINNYDVVIKDIIDTLPEQYEEYICKKSFGETVCKIRTNEGNYINSSLNEIREVIKTILFEKNKDSISMTPLIVDSCLQHYCVSMDCFKMSNSSLQSGNISKVIENELKNDWKKLVISVFCVLNLSEKANNPPPVPYINTNTLWYYINNIDNLKMMFHKDEYTTIKKRFEIELDKLGNKIKNQFNRIPLKHRIGTIIDVDQNKILKFDKIIDLFKSSRDLTLTDEIKNPIVNLLKDIDKINAASAIGTLQFVDSLAKFNTTNVICTKQIAIQTPNETYSNELKQLNLHDAVFVTNEKNPSNPYIFKQKGGKSKSHKVKKTSTTKKLSNNKIHKKKSKQV